MNLLKNLIIFGILICLASPNSNAIIAIPYQQLTANLDQPTAVAISSNGQAYVLDGVNGRVVVFNRQGQQSFSFGTIGTGQLRFPMDITIAKSKVYIADTDNHRISIFSLKGKFQQHISLVANQLSEPVALLVQHDDLIWSDRNNYRINKVSHCILKSHLESHIGKINYMLLMLVIIEFMYLN